MRISAISDVHVKQKKDPAYELLLSFLKHPRVKESTHIALLGDIFDLMCGDHLEYLIEFEEIFNELELLASEGKKVIFFEGNHDLHLTKLFKRRFKNNSVEVHSKPLMLEIENKIYYLSHGDEHEVHNLAYQRYKKVISAKPLGFVANYLMPFLVLKTIGEKASAKSRKRGSYIFDEGKVRKEFREGVEITTQGKFDFILGGHSHVKDEFKFNNSTYLNNGYALNTKTFISIKDHQVEFVPLL